MHHVLDADEHAPAQARTLLDELLLPESVRRDAALLISELVTNAIRHGQDADDAEVRVTVTLSGMSLRADVRDEGRCGTLRPQPTAPEVPGGLGLILVARLASRWGQQHDPSTCVWFEIDFGAQIGVADHPRPVRSDGAALAEPVIADPVRATSPRPCCPS